MHVKDEMKKILEETGYAGSDTFKRVAQAITESPLLVGTDEKRMIDEIVVSASRIEQRLNTEIDSFAYPFGVLSAVNQEAVRIAEARFKTVYSNVRGSILESPSRRFIFRQSISPGDPMWFVKAIIEGRMDWKYRKAQREAIDRFTQ